MANCVIAYDPCFSCDEKKCEICELDMHRKRVFQQSENTVEVVRCKDCKFNVANMDKDPLDITDYSGDDIVCSYFMTDGLEPADFCSHGAKMKGGSVE